MNSLRAIAPEVLDRYPADRPRSALLPLLSAAQELNGYVSPEAIDQIAEIIGISSAEVTGVASFYTMLHLEPKGKHVISVCHNLACSLLGAERLIDEIEETLGVVCGETTQDREFTLERAECLAACDMAPMLQVDYDRMIGPVKPARVRSLIAEIQGAELKEPATVDSEAIFVAEERPADERPDEEVMPEAEPSPVAGTGYEEPLLIESFELTRSDERLLHLETDGSEGDAP